MLLLQTVRPCRLSWQILRILRKISCKCCTFPGCGPAAQVCLWTLCGFLLEARFRLKLLPSVGLADSAALPQHIAHYSLSSAEWSGSAAFLRIVRLGRTIARFEVLRILRRTWHAFGHNCCIVLPNCTRCGPAAGLRFSCGSAAEFWLSAPFVVIARPGAELCLDFLRIFR